ncbi:MAG: nucleotide exchange factor GrpE [Patescibacteria group bacterium]
MDQDNLQPEENQEQPQAEKQIDWEDVAKRALADLDNYKKEAELRNADMVEFLKAGTVVKFMDIYDDLKRATEFVSDEQAKAGLIEVAKKFKGILHSDGLEEIDVAVGELFDPNLAEAISHEEHEVGEGKVIETVEVGLKVGGRVIKPAKVRVGK